MDIMKPRYSLCVLFTGIHNLTKNKIEFPFYEEFYQIPNLYIIQQHDLSGAQYNTMTTLNPFMSKNGTTWLIYPY